MCGNESLKCGHKMFINKFIKKFLKILRHLKGCILFEILIFIDI